MLYKDRIKRILQSAPVGYSSCIELSKTAVNNILKMLDDIDETEIFPCPFCGEIPVGPEANGLNWWIECEKCEIVMESSNKDDVIKKWNSRYKVED